jgi:hypothetical protein
VTPAEIVLLRSLCEADVVTLMPDDKTAAARARYEATLESLREMQKAGWVELEVNKPTGRHGGRAGVKRAAAVHGGRSGGAAAARRVTAAGYCETLASSLYDAVQRRRASAHS